MSSTEDEEKSSDQLPQLASMLPGITRISCFDHLAGLGGGQYMPLNQRYMPSFIEFNTPLACYYTKHMRTYYFTYICH